MEELISIMGILLEVLAIIFFATAFLGFDVPHIKSSFLHLWISSSLLVFIYQLFLPTTPIVNMAVSILIMVFLSVKLLKIKLLFSMISIIVSTCLFIFFEFISLNILTDFFNINEIFNGKISIIRLIIALPHISILILVALVIKKFNVDIIPWKLVYSEKIDPKYREHFQRYLTFMFITITIVILMIISVSFSTFHLNTGSKLVLFVVTICTIYLLFFCHQLLKFEAIQLEQHLEEQYQDDINEYFRLIKAERHDFLHHLNALYGLTLKNDFETSKEYIEELLAESMSTNESLPLYHPAMAAMLLTFKQKARIHNINMSIIVKDPLMNLVCKISEINGVMGNIIDNAIDELISNDISNKWIKVVLDSNYDDYNIIISNIGEINKETAGKIFEGNYTTKKGNHQGIGLSTAKKVVERYNGLLFLEIGVGFTSFIVNIPISKEEGVFK